MGNERDVHAEALRRPRSHRYDATLVIQQDGRLEPGHLDQLDEGLGPRAVAIEAFDDAPLVDEDVLDVGTDEVGSGVRAAGEALVEPDDFVILVERHPPGGRRDEKEPGADRQHEARPRAH